MSTPAPPPAHRHAAGGVASDERWLLPRNRSLAQALTSGDRWVRNAATPGGKNALLGVVRRTHARARQRDRAFGLLRDSAIIRRRKLLRAASEARGRSATRHTGIVAHGAAITRLLLVLAGGQEQEPQRAAD